MEQVAEVVEMATQSGSNNLFLTILVLIIAIVFIAEHIKKFRDIFGIKTRWSEHEEEQTKQIIELKSEIEHIKNEIDDIKETNKHNTEKRIEFETCVSNSLNEIKDTMIQDKIQSYRNELLDFCNAARIREYSKENYDNILQLYDLYEQLLKKQGKSNGQVDMGIQFVREKYAYYMEHGFPTYEAKM